MAKKLFIVFCLAASIQEALSHVSYFVENAWRWVEPLCESGNVWQEVKSAGYWRCLSKWNFDRDVADDPIAELIDDYVEKVFVFEEKGETVVQDLAQYIDDESFKMIVIIFYDFLLSSLKLQPFSEEQMKEIVQVVLKMLVLFIA